jgi:E3 ubiquitin-protein ligase DOA10
MWSFLAEKKLLYSTDQLTINKLTGPAPFTSLFTSESPGRAVIWLGYRIIESYMRNNKVSLEALLEDNDYQQILAKAKFRP